MTWNLDSALVTTFTLVRDNFAAFSPWRCSSTRRR